MAAYWHAITTVGTADSSREITLNLGSNIIQLGDHEARIYVTSTRTPTLTCLKYGYVQGLGTQLVEFECPGDTVVAFANSAIAIIVTTSNEGGHPSAWLTVNDLRTGLPNRAYLREYAERTSRRGDKLQLLAFAPTDKIGHVADLAILGWATKRLAHRNEFVGIVGDFVVVLTDIDGARSQRFRQALLESDTGSASLACAKRGAVIPMSPDFETAESVIGQVMNETRGSWITVDD